MCLTFCVKHERKISDITDLDRAARIGDLERIVKKGSITSLEDLRMGITHVIGLKGITQPGKIVLVVIVTTSTHGGLGVALE